MVRRRGGLIAIEGIDQAGKRTQTNLLASRMRRRGVRVSILEFPDYTTPSGRLIKAYLSGRTRLEKHSIHLLYAANKWDVAEKLSRRIKDGEVVIVNRYTPSNMAYGSAHGIPHEWLRTLEQGLPRPDLVLVLDVPPRVSHRRKRRARDLHERDLTYLKSVRKAYSSLARRYRWLIVDGMGDPETVRKLVWAKVANRFAL